MHEVVAWCGFLGAWLLVAGPVFQASIELQEEDEANEAIRQRWADLPHPKPVSGWWWLLPPVRWYLQRRRNQAVQQAAMQALDPEQREQFVDYINKATGWLYVGLGGLLIAVKETWELTELHEWPLWVFFALVVVAAAAALLNNPPCGRLRTRSVIGS